MHCENFGGLCGLEEQSPGFQARAFVAGMLQDGMTAEEKTLLCAREKGQRGRPMAVDMSTADDPSEIDVDVDTQATNSDWNRLKHVKHVCHSIFSSLSRRQ